MGRGRCQKYRKFKVQDKTQGVGTTYHKWVNLNIETLAAANVSIFGFTLVAAANISKYGNISSCYHSQPWELHRGDSLLSSKLSFYVIIRHPMKVNNHLLIFLQERQWTWCIFLAHLTQFNMTRVWQLKQHSILRVFKILASSILLSCAYNSNLENISKILVSNICSISVQCTQGWAV